MRFELCTAASAVEIEEQHPIPQQVSSYQFKLVGDMTLQQFFQVAGGALIALLIYSSGLPVYVKWPLIFISFLAGIALAFFPLEDRPLAKWIVLFMKAIYSPTLYVWKQTPQQFSYFQPEPETTQQPVQEQTPSLTNGEKKEGHEKLEIEEKKFLEKVSKDLGSPLSQLSSANIKIDQTPQKPVDIKQQDIKDTKVPIPKPENVNVEHQEKKIAQPSGDIRPKTTPPQAFKLTPSTGQVSQNVQSAKFSPDAAPPIPPTKANIIVGQVVGPEGNIVENAILEIRDQEGRPVRALRSNKLGHFMIVTPLANGTYQITTEKDGFVFDAISLNVKGEIIPPLAIWAKEEVKINPTETVKK